MEFISRYKAHIPDNKGLVNYSAEENKIWSILFERQMKLLSGRACDEFLLGLQSLELRADSIPQLPELNQRLKEKAGWQVAPVAALIPVREFFELLAQKKFPAATFIRHEDELDYIQEPDIFHEIFGHCPMLTDPVYGKFVYDYARMVLTLPEAEWPLLQRMFWFTVEFGLIQTAKGLRVYGGGILSSISELVYSVESDIPLRARFDPVQVLRTSHRIDILQPLYFVIDHYQALYDFLSSNITTLLERAKVLGDFPPLFTPVVAPDNPNIHC
jgi:phenylalanine-4-hydroxylase